MSLSRWFTIQDRYFRRLYPRSAELKAAARLWRVITPKMDGWTLDVGSGPGRLWRLVKPPDRLIRVDIDTYFLRHPGIGRWIIADGRFLPFGNGAVHAIIALGLIEYIADTAGFLRELRRVATVDGYLLLSQSPPILPNRLRKAGGAVYLRRDAEIVNYLHTSGWDCADFSPLRAGWQTLILARAV